MNTAPIQNDCLPASQPVTANPAPGPEAPVGEAPEADAEATPAEQVIAAVLGYN